MSGGAEARMAESTGDECGNRWHNQLAYMSKSDDMTVLKSKCSSDLAS